MKSKKNKQKGIKESISYAQHQQDTYLIDNIFRQHRNGYLIECGAQNGVNISNSKILIDHFDWHAILIEPHEKWFEQLKKNSPNTINYNVALYREDGKQVDFYECENRGASSIYIHEKEKILKKRRVHTRTITSILEECSYPQVIEFFSLDVEGAEMEVLKGLDFNKYKVLCFLIEHHDVPTVIEFMSSRGYKFVNRIHSDSVFIHPDCCDFFGIPSNYEFPVSELGVKIKQKLIRGR